jgi:hypothetical protein
VIPGIKASKTVGVWYREATCTWSFQLVYRLLSEAICYINLGTTSVKWSKCECIGLIVKEGEWIRCYCTILTHSLSFSLPVPYVPVATSASEATSVSATNPITRETNTISKIRGKQKQNNRLIRPDAVAHWWDMTFSTKGKTNFETNDYMSSESYTDIGKPDIPTKITRTRVCVCWVSPWRRWLCASVERWRGDRLEARDRSRGRSHDCR